MNESRFLSSRSPLLCLLAVALVSFAPALVAQDGEVTADATTSGNARPNGTVRATVTVSDASAIQSVAWEQTAGVPAALSGVNSPTVTAKLGPMWRYRNLLFHVLAEPPVGPDELPPNVPVPEAEEFPGGLQDRWQVVGVNPFVIEETALVVLEAHVTTDTGTYHAEVEIHTALPWKPSTGLVAVPTGNVVQLHGKNQNAYNWTLTTPGGSSAALKGATTQDPRFVPDVDGTYQVMVMDEATATMVRLEIYAGDWLGVIVGQDADGRPVADRTCTGCHNNRIAPDFFTPWAQTGHAEIFTDQINFGGHYSTNCFACHTVGYDPGVDNGGIDEADDYPDFLAADYFNQTGPDVWSTILADQPDTARMANIQCENCHGPQNSGAHAAGVRASLSADVCAVCHGEPLRHARFQQWQLSGHANYELASDLGGSGNCSRCHTVNGFLEWAPILLDDDPATDPLDNITVDWTADEAHPQTCVTCHPPHNVGTSSGNDPDVNIRISGDTPDLIAGFKVVGAGRGAMCMTCHNSRRGLRNDDVFDGLSDPERASHGSAQTDVLMGENAYGVNVGVRGPHSLIVDTCVTCHMVATPPPDVLSYNLGGANHTFFASEDVCAECHDEISAAVVHDIVETVLHDVEELVEEAYLDLIADLTAAGNTVDLDGVRVTGTANISAVEFGEARGRQAINVTVGGTATGFLRLGNDIDVIAPDMTTTSLADEAPDELLKAGWNWTLIHNDGSHGIHNPTYALSVLDAARDLLVGQGVGGARLVSRELPWD